jgi:acetyltransferase-like isoleucine patch superfamily enzyme
MDGETERNERTGSDYSDMTSEREFDYLELLFESIFQAVYFFVKYLPTPIGCFLRLLVLKVFMKKIQSWKIMEGATFFFPQNISIGKQGFIHDRVAMGGRGQIVIGDWVHIAVDAKIASENHSFRKGKYWALQTMVQHKTVIEDDVAIMAGCCVMAGVHVGRGALLGANSVITRNVPPNAFVSGIPAKVVGWRGEKGIEWRGSQKTRTGHAEEKKHKAP